MIISTKEGNEMKQLRILWYLFVTALVIIAIIGDIQMVNSI